MGWSPYRKTGLTYDNPNRTSKGYTLLTPPGIASAILINMAGQVVKRWHFKDFKPGFGRLLPSGTLMITGSDPALLDQADLNRARSSARFGSVSVAAAPNSSASRSSAAG